MLLRLLIFIGLLSPVFAQGTEAVYYPYSNRALMEMPAGSPLRPLRLIEGVWVVIYSESKDADGYIVHLEYETQDGRRGASIVGVPRLYGHAVTSHLFEVGAVRVVRITVTPMRISGPAVVVDGPRE